MNLKRFNFIFEAKSMPENRMREISAKAIILGSIISVILGAANAYLGLRAGMTIAATYPAAVISMAVLRLLKGNILEENISRTIGSIGESIAAGAIFTLPAFFIAGIWSPFFTTGHYIISTVIMITGGFIGVAFITLIRKVMVEDQELPYPESIAAAEIHKAGSRSAANSKFLFNGMIAGAVVKLLGEVKLFPVYWEKFIVFSKQLITGTKIPGQGGMLIGSPGVSPAYIGVGYIIGPRLGALNFGGTLIAWGMMIPMFLYILGPGLDISGMAAQLMLENKDMSLAAATDQAWGQMAYSIWRFMVRPIAIGAMIVSSAFTLYKMRKNLFEGLARAFRDFRSGTKTEGIASHDRDMPLFWVLIIGLSGAAALFCISFFIFKTSLIIAFLSSTLMLIFAFFLSAIAGYIVGVIGSSNNPVSGLTLTALVITALFMSILGATGIQGIAAVLAIAAVICVSAAVSGEMLQDLKVGYILKGTPAKMQFSNLIGVVLSGSVLFMVLAMLNEGDIARGVHEHYNGGFGSRNLSAPQANMIAMIAKGVINGNLSWPLIIAGMLMGLGFIVLQVKSPMLVFIGMYLPMETTFAVFIGGMIKGIVDWMIARKKASDAEKEKAENVGVLLASGLIAGEALMGLVIAFFAVWEIFLYDHFVFFANPSWIIAVVVLFLIAASLIYIPYKNRTVTNENASHE